MNSSVWRSHAKINLGLRILRRRRDGYHDIITLMQRISMYDEISLEPSVEKVIYEGPDLTSAVEENLCVKAVRAFQRIYGPQYGAHIKLNKVIPVGAGLGGGSSNAATVLRALANAYNLPVNSGELQKISLDVGSDVPFFVTGWPAAIAQGRGEQLTPIKGLGTDKRLIILFPNIQISTAWAYTSADAILTIDENNIIINVSKFWGWARGDLETTMTNDFEAPIFAEYPLLVTARQWLIERGATMAGLSGSGSALYGVFDVKAPVDEFVKELTDPWVSYVCHPL